MRILDIFDLGRDAKSGDGGWGGWGNWGGWGKGDGLSVKLKVKL
jgi:hypothetical protein